MEELHDFIEKYNLMVPILAAEGWNQNTNKLSIDGSLYDKQNDRWIEYRNVSDAYRVFMNQYFIFEVVALLIGLILISQIKRIR